MGVGAVPLLMAAGIGTSLYQGERARSEQREGRRRAEKAMREQEAKAAREQEDAAQRQRQANQKQPQIGSLLADARKKRRTGAGSTMLTGAAGIDPQSLQLARSSLLGQ